MKATLEPAGRCCGWLKQIAPWRSRRGSRRVRPAAGRGSSAASWRGGAHDAALPSRCRTSSLAFSGTGPAFLPDRAERGPGRRAADEQTMSARGGPGLPVSACRPFGLPGFL